MIRHYLLILGLISLLSYSLTAQHRKELAAWKNLKKENWEKAHGQLRKLLRKDSTNAVANYVYAVYFLSRQNRNFQVDSALHYLNASLRWYKNATLKQRDVLQNFPLDSAIMINLRKRIDSAAFQHSLDVNTVEAYDYFLVRFGHSDQEQQATARRDDVAFEAAAVTNTYEAFSNFITTYPKARQMPEAKLRYERLLFEQITETKRLSSYENFLREFPFSPHRKLAERHIFEISTAAGSKEQFSSFIQKYPESVYINRAKQILFHILLESGHSHLPEFLMSDSIRQVLAFEDVYLFPFMMEDKFGFMDGHGKEIFPAELNEIPREYLCEGVAKDVLVLTDRVLGKNGAVIFKGPVEAFEDLGYGFLKIITSGSVMVVHKSGFTLDVPPFDDAKVINGNFLALKKGKWGLFSLYGRELMPFIWDDIKNIGRVVLLSQDEKIKLMSAEQIGLLTDQQNTMTKDFFDEVKPWNVNYIWARAASYSGVFDQAMNIIVPFDIHTLEETFFGTVASLSSQKKVYEFASAEPHQFQDVIVRKPWVAVKQNKTWRLFEPATKKTSVSYDTVLFKGAFAVGLKNDSAVVHLSDIKSVAFKNMKLTFIPGNDSVNFLMVTDGSRSSIFNTYAEKLFTGIFDDAVYARQGFFILSTKGKKGLAYADGKYLIQPEYDAIARISENVISLLKNKKFGCYNIQTRKLISPEYDKNVMLYSKRFILAQKNGFIGFIEWDNKKKHAFDFKEIKYWNDSIAWVKTKDQWMIYDIGKKKILHDQIKHFEIISDTHDEKIALILHDDKYGVISSKTGLLIPMEFSDIRNLGQPAEPLYMAEKHVEEASVVIVTYYDRAGRLVLRNSYSEEDYENFFCIH